MFAFDQWVWSGQPVPDEEARADRDQGASLRWLVSGGHIWTVGLVGAKLKRCSHW